MNNLSSYCGLVDAKIRASDKDLPVHRYQYDHGNIYDNKMSKPHFIASRIFPHGPMGFTLYYLLKKTPLCKGNEPITEMGVAPLGIIVVSHNLAWFWTQTTVKKLRRLFRFPWNSKKA